MQSLLFYLVHRTF